MAWIFALIALGILLLLIEIFLLPGTALAGIAGLTLLGLGIYLAFSHFGFHMGLITLGITIGVSIVLLIIALRSKTWRRAGLQEAITSRANDDYTSLVRVGDRGTTISRLAPMGQARINGRTVEASAVGAMLDPNQPIEVVEVEANKIIVKPVNQ